MSAELADGQADSSPELLASAAKGQSNPVKPPAWQGEGTLREYYLHGKYPQAEIDAVSSMIDLVFPDFEPAKKPQMVAEILSFHHVVFHPTENHDLARNHVLIHQHKDLLKRLCERHDVPFYPVLAITSWENSGGIDKVSWADAAGLGQMTWGAVDEAHRYAARKALQLKEQAQWERYQGNLENDPKRLEKAEALERQAAVLNVEQRHRQMAKAAGVSDERALPECNLEDVVLFYDYLLSQYGGRIDHAIGAYHKGVLNHDDILYDYLRRRDPNVLYPQPADRSSFLNALERLNVTYLDLWNDTRSREMLNGQRTVEGEPTTRANAHLALGDESDIYPWKVLGSLSGVLEGEEYLNRAVERYSVPQLAGEVRGLPPYLGEEGRRLGADRGYLVRIGEDFWPAGEESNRQLWVRPELAGYLLHLRDRLARTDGGQGFRFAFTSLGEADAEKPDWERELHAKGVAVRISSAGLTSEQRRALKEELQQDYLFDRIYLRSGPDEHHLVVNPRFGHELTQIYESKAGIRRVSNSP